MRLDIADSPEHPAQLSRFQLAGAQRRRLLRGQVLLAALVVTCWLLMLFAWLFAPASLWTAWLANQAAVLILLGAALQAAMWPLAWRLKVLGQSTDAPAPAPAETGWYARTVAGLQGRGLSLLKQIGEPSLCLAGWALLALINVRIAWDQQPQPGDLGQAGMIAVALTLLLTFALLVIERHWHNAAAAAWPEAKALASITRLVMCTLCLGALSLAFSRSGSQWPVTLAVWLGLVPVLLALELLARAVAAVFAPRRDTLEPVMIADSLLAGVLHWPPRPLHALQQALHTRLGIDLRQVWAFHFMRRAALPIVALIALFGWAVTGVRQVPLDGRVVYERFGSPVAVLGPGLHLILPWPMGQTLAVENGVVHAISTQLDANTSVEPATADGPAPVSANRLWDATHARDNTQVIASASAERQNFQVVNMDVRFVYRIGLTDVDALAASYHSADLPTLIRNTAGQVLVHSLASRTLDDLLGADRKHLSHEIGEAVQQRLDKLDSGVQILATVIEAIHPPAGAANAYHGVQAAQIAALAAVARERGEAEARRSEARLDAADRLAQATAGAAESQSGAKAAQTLFDAERQAYAGAGHTFLFERYLEQLSQGLPHAQVLVLDHRLGGGNAPTLDLRTFLAPVDAPAATR